jgi:hypothetical protein
MKLIKTLIATFALLSIAAPSHAQRLTITVGGSNSSSSGLPPTNLDSFVYQSGYNTNIYGDEGDVDIPPLNSFQKDNRINAGINGQNAAGLTTGHGSYMPDAWGADEFLSSPGEWDFAGQQTNNSTGISATLLNATQAAAAAIAAANVNTNLPSSNITSNANVNGSALPDAPAAPAAPAFMTNPAAWISAFGTWATATVPYALTQGMVPVQDSTNGLLMGWMAPGTSLSQFLSGQTGLLLPSEQGEAQTMLSNLAPSNDYVVPGN